MTNNQVRSRLMGGNHYVDVNIDVNVDVDVGMS